MQADVVIIGAGPGGMAAAITLAEHNAKVCVVDEQAAPGGQVYRAIEKVRQYRPEDLSVLGADYQSGAELVQRFRDSGAQYMPSTSVWELEPHPSTQSFSVHTSRNGQGTTLAARRVLLATGAMERPTPFPGWTLPGVMTIGAAQTLLKGSGLLPSGRVVVAGAGPLLHLFTWQLQQAGVRPERILNTGRGISWSAARALPGALQHGRDDLLRGLRWMRTPRQHGVQTVRGVRGLRATGNEHLKAVEYQTGDGWQSIDADLLLVHDGVIPNTWMAMSVGCKHYYNTQQHYWAPETDDAGASSVDGISIIGDAAGIGGSKLAQTWGRLAALDIARRLGHLADAQATELASGSRAELHRQLALRQFLDQYFAPAPMFTYPPDDDTIVCRCEEITVAEVKAVASQGVVGPNQAKAFTRCGMGPCMGRKCAPTVSRLIARHHNLPVSEVGHYKIRPPIRPITVGDLADMTFDEDGNNKEEGATMFDQMTGSDK